MMRVAPLIFAATLTACGATGGAQSPGPVPGTSAPESPAAAPSATSPVGTATAPPEPNPEPEPSNELAPTASLSPVPQPTSQGGPWIVVGRTVSTAEEAAAAQELPPSFREFLAVRLGYADETGCVATRVDVRGVHPDGFVLGDEESSCGDNRTVWGMVAGRWHYIVAFQDALTCRELARHDIPTGAPGLRCVDDDGRARDH